MRHRWVVAILVAAGLGLLLIPRIGAEAPEPGDLTRAASTLSRPAESPGLRGAQVGHAKAESGRVRAEEPTRAEGIQAPTVRPFALESSPGWARGPGLGCTLVVTSAPAWYGHDESVWPQGGRSLADSYPSDQYPDLGDADCVAAFVGHIATGADAWNVEALLVVNGAVVMDAVLGSTGGHMDPTTGPLPRVRWNLVISRDVLEILAKASTAQIRFRPRTLSREEELTEKRPVQLGGKRLTMREYIALLRPPPAVWFSDAALAEFRRIQTEAK